MKYIIAIDQGTTSTRSILFDELCNVVAVDQMEISLNFPKNGWVEQNPEEIWQTVYLTIKDVINKSNIDIRKKYGFANCRSIMTELLEGNVQVGITNAIRNSDGIIRKIAPIMEYKNNYYPYLAFNAGSDYLAKEDLKDFVIDKSLNLQR